MGIATDVFFVEGLFESLKELGVAGNRMHTRDANGASVIEPRGYVAMGQRVGATVAPVKNTIAAREDANDAGAFVWKEVPGGVVSHTAPLPVALQRAECMEPERGEIQGSRNGFDPRLEELAGQPCRALSAILRQVGPISMRCKSWRSRLIRNASTPKFMKSWKRTSSGTPARFPDGIHRMFRGTSPSDQ